MPVPSLFLGSAPLARLAILSFLTSGTAALAYAGQGAYTYYGCVNEDPAQRILYGSHTDYPGMTLESCASDCAGYTYFGTEYGTECYCGNDFAESPIIAPDGYCWMTCDGNSAEFCGGPMFLSVYSFPVAAPGSGSSSSSSSIAAASSTSTSSASPSAAASSSSSAVPSSSSAAASSTTSSSSAAASSSFSSSAAPSSSSAAASSTTSSSAAPSSTCVRLGCFTEAGATTPDRTLYDYHYINYGLMSPDICASTCSGYSYFGLEYSGECYCGNQINPASYMVPDAQCAMPCGGDPAEFCGSGNRLDLYSCVGPLSSSSSAAASTSSSAAASSTSVAASSTSGAALPFVLAGSPAAPTSTSSSSSSVPTSSSSTLAAASTSSSSSSMAMSSSTSSADPPPALSTSSSTTSVSSVDPPHYHHHHHHPTSSTSNSSTGVSSSGTMASSTSLSSPCPSSTTTVSTPHTLTSTIYSATTYTITSCAATVTDCPARIGKVTTEIVTLYTTYCPEAGKTTPTPSPSALPAPQYTTSTMYTTTVYTITSCAATVTNCPAKIGQLTTESIALYTTTYPVAGNPLPTPGAIGSPVLVGAPAVTLPPTANLAGSSMTPLPTAQGAGAPIYPAGNGTTFGLATAKSTVSGGAAKTTVSVVPVAASASGAEKFGASIFAGVVAAIGALVLL